MLPKSLKDLNASFDTDKTKGIFPFKLNDINYSGIVPDIKYFDNLTIGEYNKYKDQFNGIWNFRESSLL